MNNLTAEQFELYTDTEIIDKITTGDTKLYEILIRRYNAALYKIGRSYRYNHHDTEDLMQETYISAFYSLTKFEKRSSFKTWITRIMLNNCFQKKQKFSFKNEMPVADSPAENKLPQFQQPVNTEKMIMNKELGHVLENALTKIPEGYRMVFTLRELNGLTVLETTEALSITESNVKVRLNRAKKMLQAEIEKMYSPNDIFEFNLVYCDSMVEKVMLKITAN
jgi:RNA polymerase sigma-70 factor (ECF subfamily)